MSLNQQNHCNSVNSSARCYLYSMYKLIWFSNFSVISLTMPIINAEGPIICLRWDTQGPVSNECQHIFVSNFGNLKSPLISGHDKLNVKWVTLLHIMVGLCLTSKLYNHFLCIFFSNFLLDLWPIRGSPSVQIWRVSFTAKIL